MNGIYWGLTALAFMGRIDALDKEEMIRWVFSCWNEEIGECTVDVLAAGGCIQRAGR